MILILSVIVSLFNIISSDSVYYIVPSLKLCTSHEQPCLTLSEFAVNSSIYLTLRSTLFFSSGNHFLESEFLIESVDKISMLSGYRNTMSTTIMCDQQFAWFLYDSVTTLIINGLTFHQCNHQANIVVAFTLENCVFLNHVGTVIELFNSVVYIAKSTFISNSGGSFRFHSVGYQLQSSYAGAVVTILESSAIISTSVFQHNDAEIGAVVYCESHSNVTFINSTFTENNATKDGGVAYIDGGCIVGVHGCIFENNSALSNGGVFEILEGTLFIEQSSFSHNQAREGGAISFSTSSVETPVTISESIFANNSASFVGGAVAAVNVTLIICDYTKFYNNKAEFGGGAVFINLGLVTIIDGNFSNNSVPKYGGGAFLLQTEINISSTVLIGNRADIGGALALQQVNMNLNICKFSKNFATMEGGAIIGERCKVIIEDAIFEKNFAHSGGVLFMSEYSSITTSDIVFERNSASEGIVYFTDCSALFTCNTSISRNVGSLIIYYSSAVFRDIASISFNGLTKNLEKNMSIISQGGAITAFQSIITFEGKITLMCNTANNGGGIRAILSKLHVSYGHMLISNNTALESGGGIYLYQSELECRNLSNVELRRNDAMVNGGGIHAVSSTITADYDISGSYIRKIRPYSGSRIRFVGNDAVNAGGGIYLENGAKIIVFSKSDSDKPYYTIVFDGNTADYGGALYVADETISATCASTSFNPLPLSTTTECFLQTLELRPLYATPNFIPNYVNTKFVNNHALIHGSDLFGGLLDRCTESPFKKKTKTRLSVVGFKYFMVFSNLKSTETISSDPVRVCFCHNDKLNCSYQPPPIKIRKGEAFKVSLAAVDHVNHTVSTSIHSYPIKSKESGIGEGQFIQSTTNNSSCTNLTFNVFSRHEDEELIVFAGGPCKDATLSQRRIQIKFLPCTCPIGFKHQIQAETRCVCECDTKLGGYVKECKFETQTLVRQGQPWISYIQTVPANFSDYLIYPYCPLSYCKDDSDQPELNLNTPDGTDGQCAAFRTGTLCGACQPNYSLSLGTTRCIKCPAYWPAIFVIILVSSFLAGLALVAVILVLNLTVAVGTLNGVIFYANIVYANIHTFHPNGRLSFSTVFISWLNLDIGSDVCFVKGMDAYWKTWLQLIFPLYMFFLVLMVILISERSKRFSMLIGKKNPVATLATLILLSYAKLLHIIITALSSTTLNYPGPAGGYKRKVWLPDATIDYLKGKHVPLFLVAIIVLLAGIVYTTLLFSWQWLQYFGNYNIMKWTRNPKVSSFIAIYHVPNTPQNRYWSGLLLFVRAILYIASAANESGDPKINLLILGSVITGVLVISKIVGIGKRVYKKWPIEALEVASYMNLILLSLATFFCLGNVRARKAATNISVSIMLLLLLGVLFYHVLTELIMKRLKKVNGPLKAQSSEEQSERVSDPSQISAVTRTVVDAPKKVSCTTYTNSDHELRETLLDYS